MDGNAVRNWTNELAGHELFVDKAGLEDHIRWQGLEFEVLEGYYFDEGRNPRLSEVMTRLYENRRRMKAEGNPAQEVLKLIMNSAYGRTILKPTETDLRVIPHETYESYLSMNYAWIESTQKIGDLYYVKRYRAVDEHYNACHCGIDVLNMSKRNMSEVMTLAQDEGHPIYYQDTDRMHIPSRVVPPSRRCVPARVWP